MLFHFQIDGPSGWEPVGAGEAEADGDGELEQAIADLDSLAGGLEPGEYQALPAKGRSTRWLRFRVEDGGSVVHEGEFSREDEHSPRR